MNKSKFGFAIFSLLTLAQNNSNANIIISIFQSVLASLHSQSCSLTSVKEQWGEKTIGLLCQ